MHIAERMGELVGITVKWQHDKMQLHGREKSGIESQILKLKSTPRGLYVKVEHYGGVILCDRSAAHKEARVLQGELSQVLQKPVLVGGNMEEEVVIKTLKEADVVVALLMTADVLADG